MKRKIGNLFRISTENLGDSLIPKKLRKTIQEYFRRAGINEVPYFLIGLTIYLCIILSFIIQALLLTNSSFSNIDVAGKVLFSVVAIPIMYILFISITFFIIRLYLDIKIQLRINEMEDKFPDFLSTLALNLRMSGTLHVALENATDKEFGVLSDEIKLVVRSIRLGNTEESALKDFMEKYESNMMSDSFELILLSWKKGGNTANLVERLYENMKSSKFLKDKVIASVTNYRIFLTTLAVVIAPAMFALTFYLIDLIRRISKQVSSIPDNVALPFSINEVRVNDSGFILFAVLCVILISISIAFIISIVRTGKANYAFKQMLIYAILSFISFQIFMVIFKLFFSLFAI